MTLQNASHCAKILSVFYDNLDTTSDPNDPEVIIKIDISISFNTIRRAMCSVDSFLVTMLVASYGGMLLNPPPWPFPAQKCNEKTFFVKVS